MYPLPRQRASRPSLLPIYGLCCLAEDTVTLSCAAICRLAQLGMGGLPHPCRLPLSAAATRMIGGRHRERRGPIPKPNPPLRFLWPQPPTRATQLETTSRIVTSRWVGGWWHSFWSALRKFPIPGGIRMACSCQNLPTWIKHAYPAGAASNQGRLDGLVQTVRPDRGQVHTGSWTDHDR